MGIRRRDAYGSMEVESQESLIVQSPGFRVSNVNECFEPGVLQKWWYI